MRIAITGATGFVGQNLAAVLTGQGHQVVGLSRQSNALAAKLAPAVSEWIQGDLQDVSVIRTFVRNIDAIIHAGWWTPGKRFVGGEGDPAEYYRQNVLGSVRLWEEAVAHDVSRFVFLSTGAVHASVMNDRPLDENHPLRPASWYGAAKSAVETFIHATAFAPHDASSPMVSTTLRPTSIVGLTSPWEQSKYFALVSNLLEVSKANRDPSAEWLAERTGKVVHVLDLCDAVSLVLHAKEKDVDGKTLNCTGGALSHFEIASHLVDKLQLSVRVIDKTPVSPHPMSTAALESLGMTFQTRKRVFQDVMKIAEHLA